jgi:rare lipoprotein A
MAPVKLRSSLFPLLVAVQLLLPINTLPVQAETTAESSGQAQSAEQAQPAEKGDVGIASYYAKRYNGRRTTSGARYNPQKMTAAHSSMPLGTKVKVVNIANGREVVVTVNDRCRTRKKPFIDLSRAAAQKLGFLGKGIARVRITPLDDEQKVAKN